MISNFIKGIVEGKGNMERLTIKAPSGLIHLKDNTEKTINTAIKKLSDLEDLEEQGKLLKLPCAVGDMVYYRYDGIKIEPMRVEEIIVAKYGIALLLKYCGNDEKLKYWKINIESTAIDCKILFLTREAAEAALKEMSE